ARDGGRNAENHRLRRNAIGLVLDYASPRQSTLRDRVASLGEPKPAGSRLQDRVHCRSRAHALRLELCEALPPGSVETTRAPTFLDRQASVVSGSYPEIGIRVLEE